MDNPQLMIFSLEAIVIAGLLLFLFRIRTRFGLVPLYVTLGVFQPIQTILASSVYLEILPGMIVSPGSVIMFTASQFAILLVYLFEDAIETRRAIYGLVIANLSMTLLLFVFGMQLELLPAVNFLNLSSQVFFRTARAMLVGSILLLSDVILIIYLYEALWRALARSLFLHIYLTMAIVLTFDSLVFTTATFYGEPQFATVLTSGIIGRLVIAAIYASALTLYLRLAEAGHRQAHSFHDIFSMLSYRQKFELERRHGERVTSMLNESEGRYQTLATISPVGIFRTDASGVTTYVNPKWSEISGISYGEALGDGWLAAVHPEDRETLRNGWQESTREKRASARDYRFIRPDGSIAWVIGQAVPEFDGEGQVAGYIGTITDITDRKQAELALQRERDFSDAILKGLPGVLYLYDESLRFLRWNRNFEQVTGYSSEEIGRMSPLDFFAEHEKPYMAARIRDVFETGQSIAEAEVLTKNGDTIPYFFTGMRTEFEGRTCLIGVGVNNTERMQAQEKIQGHIRRLNALREIDQAITSTFDLNVSLYILLHQTVKFLPADAAAVLLLDPVTHSLHYAAGRGFRNEPHENELLKLDQTHAGKAVLERRRVEVPDLASERQDLLQARLFKGEGFLQYYAMPLNVKGQVLGVLEVYQRSNLPRDEDWFDFLSALADQAAIVVDNSQLWEQLQRQNLKLEQRVAERTLELNKTNAELEHANRAKDEFLANMSHELRTPLNSILGLAESLLEQQRGPLNEDQQRYLQIIRSSGVHLLELINDVLDLSKIEAGKFDYYPQVVDLEAVCQSSLSFVKEQAVRKSITLSYVNENAASKMYADPRRLKQILVNLLANAVKFTPEKGRVTLEVHLDEEQDLVQLSVSDSGIGISPEDLKRLFQPFVQARGSLNREFEGTGLGLALVQKLTDLHGGSVQVESEVSQGSRFTINLPWNREQVKEEDRKGAEPAIQPGTGSAQPSPFKRKVILLAEDNLANILTIGEYLERSGYTVVVAHDGWEALAKAEEVHPDIILMDIQMPSLDGLETIRRLRQDLRFVATPIVALTALAMPGDRERCLEAGASGYMSKPVSLKNLLRLIESSLHPEKGSFPGSAG